MWLFHCELLVTKVVEVLKQEQMLLATHPYLTAKPFLIRTLHIWSKDMKKSGLSRYGSFFYAG